MDAVKQSNFHPSRRMLPHVSSMDSAHCLLVECYCDVLLPGNEVRACTEKECINRPIFAQICCIFALLMELKTQGTPAVGMGYFLGHGGRFFSQAPGFCFLEILKTLLPSQPCENSPL